MIPGQAHPFVSASSLEDLCKKLTTPLVNILPDPPAAPEVTQTSNPPHGGESAAWERLTHLAKSGALTSYKDTRNGLVGTDYSTKLSSYLAIGCLTARQVHEELLKLENGASDDYKDALGFGGGENDGTKGIRFELLWRDYMRLCTAKFGRNLFRLSGFRQEKSYDKRWNTPSEKDASPNQSQRPAATAKIFERFKNGTTGMGLIDASQRELYLTGYTSNRARQNVASFLSKHLGIDWRYGAEWYEMLLVDYDVSSNWANWQYVAGVGNDPRGDARTFNPVKQAFDYDKEGTFVRAWIPELQGLEKLENLFQVWTTEADDLERCGLSHNNMATDPVKKIDFHVDRKPRSARRTLNRRRGQQRGGRWGSSHNHQSHSNESGTSSDATASETAAGVGGNGNGEARNQVGSQATVVHSPTNVSTWRGNYSGGGAPPPHTHGYGNRGWHNGDQSRGGRGYGQYRGYWRPSGPRGGFMSGYQGVPAPPQMVFHPQYPGPAQ